jgi:patatin-like phospholipase/acyl hydrolase
MGMFSTSKLNLEANLNSGGIRGIVELEVLREIEIYLGGQIPIQAFFDLIVGTR